jgi:type II secretory pathway component PulF
MSYKNQSRMPGLVLALIFLILSACVLLIFVVPHFLSFYSETGTPLPPALRVVEYIMHVIKQSQILMIPMLVIAFLAVLAWWIYITVKIRKYKDQ